MSLASTLNQLLPSSCRPVELATTRYLRWSNGRVQGGPFRGLRYVSQAHCSALAPKIAGTYEQEIQPFLAAMIATAPDAFIDIGAAEGYYAVGAAAAGWCPRIIAFEAEPAARAELADLMALNQVPASRLEVHGICTPDALNELLATCTRPAVLMDVEGFEAFLLDPLRLPALARCHLLVEHHDFTLPGLAAEIRRRMEPTHLVTEIEQTPRHAEQLVCSDPLVRLFPAGVRRRVLSERRPFSRHGWLGLTPRITS